MQFKFHTPILLWKWSYIVVNILALLIMLASGEMMGDAQGLILQRPEWIVMACASVSLAYWFILGPFFRFLERVATATLKFGRNTDLIDDRLGIFLIGAQACFMIFNIAFGVNVAGSGTTRADSSLGLIWVVLPVDSLFLIYYAVARDSRFFKYNLLMYIASNIMRGWLGIFLFIIFLEMARAAHLQKIKWKKLVPLVAVVLVFYPVMLNFKWLFRAAVASDASILEGMSGLFESLSGSDYLDVIGSGVTQIIGRLQITSSVAEVIRYSSQLEDAFVAGVLKPFWLEGLHGIVYDRIMYSVNRPAIGVAFTSIGDFSGDFDVGSWNTNTGWVGWFFVAPVWIPVFIAYTASLCYLSFFLAKNISKKLLLTDLVWFSWLVFLMPGWLGAFVGFIYSLFVFLILKWILSEVPKLTIWGKNEQLPGI